VNLRISPDDELLALHWVAKGEAYGAFSAGHRFAGRNPLLKIRDRIGQNLIRQNEVVGARWSERSRYCSQG